MLFPVVRDARAVLAVELPLGLGRVDELAGHGDVGDLVSTAVIDRVGDGVAIGQAADRCAVLGKDLREFCLGGLLVVPPRLVEVDPVAIVAHGLGALERLVVSRVHDVHGRERQLNVAGGLVGRDLDAVLEEVVVGRVVLGDQGTADVDGLGRVGVHVDVDGGRHVGVGDRERLLAQLAWDKARDLDGVGQAAYRGLEAVYVFGHDDDGGEVEFLVDAVDLLGGLCVNLLDLGCHHGKGVRGDGALVVLGAVDSRAHVEGAQ